MQNVLKSQDKFYNEFIAKLSSLIFILSSHFILKTSSLCFQDSQGFKCSNLLPLL